MKQLDRVATPELAPLKEKLLKTAQAGYREGVLSDLWRDVNSLCRDLEFIMVRTIEEKGRMYKIMTIGEYHVFWTQTAQKDLKKIMEYIVVDNVRL